MSGPHLVYPTAGNEALEHHDPAWKADAACGGADPDLFFGPSTVNGVGRETDRQRLKREAQAKLICAACPVEHECLTYALETKEKDGIWGGLDERQRRKLRRGRTAGTEPKTCCDCGETKPAAQFHLRDKGHSRRPYCKACGSKRSVEARRALKAGWAEMRSAAGE